MKDHSLQRSIEVINQALDSDQETTALQLVESAYAEALALDEPTALVWELADLLLELGIEDKALLLAEKQFHLLKEPENAISYATILAFCEQQEKSISILKKAIKENPEDLNLVGCLLELAVAEINLKVFDDIDLKNPDAIQLVRQVKRRFQGFDTENIDSRRYAYTIAKVVILGMSEDESDRVQPYWFFNIDEIEAAWLLRRFLAWLSIENIKISGIFCGDAKVKPFALALADLLNLSVSEKINDSNPESYSGAPVVRVFSALRRFEDVPPPPLNSRVLTLSLGIEEVPSWEMTMNRSPVDIVGVIAPIDIAWNSDLEFPSDPQTAHEDRANYPKAADEEISKLILQKLSQLPEDRALQDILRFYQENTERTFLNKSE